MKAARSLRRAPSAIAKKRLRRIPFVAARSKLYARLPKEPLFVGSYHRIPVKIPSKLKWEDVEFTVPDGPRGGLVSPSRDVSFQVKKPHFMLLAGYEPGVYTLEARHRTTSALLFKGKFEVTALWKNEKEGPSFWFTGIAKSYAAGSAWGVGPAGPRT